MNMLAAMFFPLCTLNALDHFVAKELAVAELVYHCLYKGFLPKGEFKTESKTVDGVSKASYLSRFDISFYHLRTGFSDMKNMKKKIFQNTAMCVCRKLIH